MTLSPRAETMRRRISNPLAFWFWLLVKLPAAWWCGVRLREISTGHCVTSVPYGWRSQNPFRSTYFAALAMAAEMSTGALVLLAAEDAGVPMSTLIIDMKASYGKKAAGRATFRCDGGEAVFRALAEAKASGEARTVALETVGRLDDGTEVARFSFTWSARMRSTPASG
ncbi:MAG: DUF4442 domain-containing protein [Deltaproteobacteria bacterium]|nr:DUF4442 domain-containing protein [Deltaproteobacteria bacterium]